MRRTSSEYEITIFRYVTRICARMNEAEFAREFATVDALQLGAAATQGGGAMRTVNKSAAFAFSLAPRRSRYKSIFSAYA